MQSESLAVGWLLYMVVGAYPVWLILKRMGFDSDRRPMYLVACLVVPVIMLWVLASGDWPALKRSES